MIAALDLATAFSGPAFWLCLFALAVAVGLIVLIVVAATMAAGIADEVELPEPAEDPYAFLDWSKVDFDEWRTTNRERRSS